MHFLLPLRQVGYCSFVSIRKQFKFTVNWKISHSLQEVTLEHTSHHYIKSFSRAVQSYRCHRSPEDTFRAITQPWLHLLHHCLERIPPEEQTFNLAANMNSSKYFLSGLSPWHQSYSIPSPCQATLHILSVPLVCSSILYVASLV